MAHARRDQVGVVCASAVGLALGYSVIGMATFGLFVVPLSNHFGWGRGDIAIAYTLMCYTLAAASPIAGLAVDRFGIRRVLLPSIVLFSIAYAMLATVDGAISHYYLLYVMLAIFGAGTAPPTYAQLLVLWFDRRRGLALGLGLAGVGIGTTLLPFYMQSCIDRFGYRGGYVATAALALAASFPLAYFFLHEPRSFAPNRPYGHSTTEIFGFDMKQCLRQRVFWQMLVAFVLLGLFTSGLITQLVPLLVDRGMSAKVAASALSLLGFTMIIGRVVTGFLLDRIFAPFVVGACVVIAIVGVALLWADASEWSAFLATILVGFAVGAELDFMSYLVSRYQGLRAYGQVYGFMYGVFILGSGVGPLVMGYAQQQAGRYDAGLRVLLFGTLVALPLLLTLGRYPRFGLCGKAGHGRSDSPLP